MDTKQLAQKLLDLDKKAEEFDQALRNLRSEMHNVLWDLMELKSAKSSKNAK